MKKKTLIGHDAAVNVVKFSPDSKYLVSGGDDNYVLLWPLDEVANNVEEIQPIKLAFVFRPMMNIKPNT